MDGSSCVVGLQSPHHRSCGVVGASPVKTSSSALMASLTPKMKQRSQYAVLDQGSMLDVSNSPSSNGLLSTPKHNARSLSLNCTPIGSPRLNPKPLASQLLPGRGGSFSASAGGNKANVGGFFDYYKSLESAVKQKRASAEAGLSGGGGITDGVEKDATEKSEKDEKEKERLPSGWERHEDDEGPYYWHIASGTIQRECPVDDDTASQLQSNNTTGGAPIDGEDGVTNTSQGPVAPSVVMEADPNGNESATCQVAPSSPAVVLRRKKICSAEVEREMQIKRQSCPQFTKSGTQKNTKKKPIRFSVRSLGWVEIKEEDLTPERSSRAVNRCINQLDCDHRGDVESEDCTDRWGDGKELYMDVDDTCLRLIDPTVESDSLQEERYDDDVTTPMNDDIDDDAASRAVLHEQPIHAIRVWGVGRDNGRDFAYVGRDRASGAYLCHVFRCDMPARIIANTLRDVCKRAMIERGLVVMRNRNAEHNHHKAALQAANRFSDLIESTVAIGAGEFPTPMEEPKKMLRALYVGGIDVARASGMEMLNGAIERLVSVIPPYRWRPVRVTVAPSVVIVRGNTPEGKEETLVEARVRFIAFLGVGRHPTKAAFIAEESAPSGERRLRAHVFHCEPSAEPLCKTLEAACKLRFQKCMDALQRRNRSYQQQQSLPEMPVNGGQPEPEVQAEVRQSFSALSLAGVKSALSNTFSNWVGAKS